jgi:hypothetical protein
MAGQYFYAKENKFWIDLHECATYEAESILEMRIKECFSYGVQELEVIYGTPDVYEGSLEQAVKEIIKNNEKIDSVNEIHAGIIIRIAKNPVSMSQNESMLFSGFSPSYKSRYKFEPYEMDYHPCRKEYSTGDISNILGCTVDYVRSIISKLPDNQAESIKEYNSITRRNETTWRIYKKGMEEVTKRWRNDSNTIMKVLHDLDADDKEIKSILITFRTPIDLKKPSELRLKRALTRLRRNKDK